MVGSRRKEGNYETMLNILQYKEKRLKVGGLAKRGGIWELGGGRFGLPVLPPTVIPFVKRHISQVKSSRLCY